MARVVLHQVASKQLSKYPESVEDRIRSKLLDMVEDEWRDLVDYDVKQLAGTQHDIYRARIGNYRVFFVAAADIIAIIHIDRREGAYGNVDKLSGRVDDFLDR